MEDIIFNQPAIFKDGQVKIRPPLWSSGQGIWLQIQRSRVRFPALPDFSEWQWVWNGVHSASVRSIEELLE